MGPLGGVGVRHLRGPTLVNPQQEEVYRLRDLHLHVHLRPVLPSFTAGTCGSGPDTVTYFAPELDGGSAAVRLGVGVVGEQPHLDHCIQIVHAHQRLAARGDKSK